MKTLLYSLFAAIAAAGAGLAQTVTVTLLPTATSQCVFTASAVTFGIINHSSINSGTGSVTVGGPMSLGPVTITKAAGLCSSALVVDSFRAVASVTVTVTAPSGSGTSRQTLMYTLTNALVTSITDKASGPVSNVPMENVTLTFQAIKISDLVDNTLVTCSSVTNTCN